MINEIHYSNITDISQNILSKNVSPVEVVQAHLDRIDKINPKLNAIVTLADNAIQKAQDAEREIMHGEWKGPLHGIPFTIKDCIDIEGMLTTRGSRIFSNHIPNKNATTVQRLLDAGGIIIGHTNMPEFALWWETGNDIFGFTENPWLIGRTTGGSSGGEAAAISSGLSPLGIGSDVGGSIRQPASFCGIVGLKATHGRIPLTGHFPETLLRFMHVGPMARTVLDTAIAFKILAGPDRIDHYSVPVAIPDLANLSKPLPKLRIAWCAEGPFAPVSNDIQSTVINAAKSLDSLGCEVEEVSLNEWVEHQPQDISVPFFTGEGSYYLDPIIKDKTHMLAPSMQKRIRQSKPTPDEIYKSVQGTEWIREKVMDLFRNYDILLLPTSTTTPFTHDSSTIEINGKKVPGRNSLRITLPFDLTGSPAISIPFAYNSEGLPIGIQLIGRHFDEETVLHTASVLEKAHLSEARNPDI